MIVTYGLVAVLLLAATALFSRSLSKSILTMPMICLALGLGWVQIADVQLAQFDKALKFVTEITLAIVLFVDATRLYNRTARLEKVLPCRTLLIGLPLTMALGTLVMFFILPDIGLWGAALVAALLTPTDAALGRAVFANEGIPERVRDTLTIESGMNDGLSLPAIIFLASAVVGFEHAESLDNWVLFAFDQIAFGIGVGVVIGAAGGWLSHQSVERGWAFENNTAIFGLMLVGVSYLLAELVGGNSFVAVFVSGLFFGRVARSCASRARKFLDTDGELLMMVSFFYIGAIMLPDSLAATDWRIACAVLLSLFVIRPVAVWLSLLGSDATGSEKLLLCWFGPRGLATALFTLIILEQFMEELPADTLIGVTGLAVMLSTVLHGVSAHYAAAVCKTDHSAS